MTPTANGKKKSEKTPVGELRPSQMLYTYGVGAIVDLPRLAVMVMGLDDWDTTHTRAIEEERLLAAVRAEVGDSVQELRTPPQAPEANGPLSAPGNIGVPVAAFPRWMICPRCRYLGPLSTSNPLIELKVNPYRPDRTAYVHANCNRAVKRAPEMVPVRFLVACNHGHLDDFPWHSFVHKGPSVCTGRLFLFEFGIGDLADTTVKCEGCGATRRMTEAFGEEAQENVPTCTARRPHLRDRETVCSAAVKPILLGASNSWFPLSVSTLHLPTTTDRLAEMVELYWGDLKDMTALEILTYERRKGRLPAFDEFDEDVLWGAIQTKRNQGPLSLADPTDIKTPEWTIFRSGAAPPGRDLQLTPVAPPRGYEWCVKQTVLVEKLREVKALIGFTRIESPGEFADAREIPPEQRAPLSRRPPSWVPATEVRGEGIFLEFDLDKIREWADAAPVRVREQQFLEAHRQWRKARGLPPDQHFPGIGYVLIHSLSHTLMRQLSIECGYTAASIRERIYWPGVDGITQDMAGLLIYTAAPDSEGTLGGLVSLGEPSRLGVHFDQALDMIRLCASDPLCAEHLPLRDGITLHAAACHACQFAPETSCERSNKYLDRTLLVETTEVKDLAFFPTS
ncbi:MAG: DUF1998 domain-containing protein [Armatimonas sp.]